MADTALFNFLLSRGVLLPGRLTSPACRACPWLGHGGRPGCLDLGDPALPTSSLGESCSPAPEGKSSLVSTGDVQYRCSCCKFALRYQRAKVCFAKHCPRHPPAPWPGAAGRAAISQDRGSLQPLLSPPLLQQHLTSAGPGETVFCFLSLI